jgi:hypothetical protein
MHRVAVLRLRTVLPTDWNYLKCGDQFLGAGFGLLVGKLYAATAGILYDYGCRHGISDR